MAVTFPGERSASWTDRWLPSDPKRRLRSVQTALASLFALGSIGFMWYGVLIDTVTVPAALVWMALTIGGALGFSWAIASGWSERLSDPSMTVTQMVYAISCCATAYASAGALRGAIFLLLMVVMLFGMFALPTRKIWLVCGYAAAAMGVAMAVLVLGGSPHTTPMVEAGHLLMVVLMMPAVAVLAERLRQMRERLRQQKRELADALERIQYLATRDALTGLMNRHHMTELLERELLRHRRSGSRVCVALLDLDHFKQINDRYGHGCGDAVLRAFADAARRTVRGSDALARWGGEEFLLLMPDTDLAGACAGADRLRQMLEALSFEHEGVALTVSVSGGVAELVGNEALEAAIDRADRALYRAKGAGRNRVVSSG